jgi:hypothetical protein
MPWFFKTKVEQARDEIRRAQRKDDKAAQRDSDYFAHEFPNWLANCGLDHWLPRPDRPSRAEAIVTGARSRQKVRIIEARYNQHAIYLWIDTRELPYNVTLPDLYTDRVMETLSANAGRQVVWRSEPGRGSWYVIWRNGAINAIPEKFHYNDAVMMIPKNAGPLYFIAGVAENNTLIRADLAQMPHYLVAGSTGQGKSVHLNQLLCQLISRNTPDTLQMTMIDLKSGNEFSFYEKLPHLWKPIITRPPEVLPVLDEFYSEMERRSELFRSVGVKDIEGYNDKYPNEKLPRMLLIFDELALLLLDRDRKMVSAAEDTLSNILARSRSAGGNCILCTQDPRSEIVKAYIKVNCSTRICFAVPSMRDSMVVIDYGAAAGLQPHGRAIMLNGATLTEIQSPYISNEQISHIVKEAIQRGGQTAKRPDEITFEDVIEEAIHNYGGKLHRDRLYKSFKGKIGRDRLEEMIDLEKGKIVLLDGKRYEVVIKGRGIHGGRYLKALDNDDPGDRVDPQLKLIIGGITPQSPHSILKAKPSATESKAS